MDGVADTVVSNLRLIDNTATSFGGGMRMRICSIQFFNLFATYGLRLASPLLICW